MPLSHLAYTYNEPPASLQPEATAAATVTAPPPHKVRLSYPAQGPVCFYLQSLATNHKRVLLPHLGMCGSRIAPFSTPFRLQVHCRRTVGEKGGRERTICPIATHEN